jgi:tungstate transport system ATP-binding protein
VTPFLSIEGLQHSYDDRQVLNVDGLEVHEGEILAVVGPNGSGKSTLLRMVNLLEEPTQGDITYWDGSRLSEMNRKQRRELSRQMAMIFQEPLLFKRTVRANVAYGLKIRRMDGEERDKRVDKMLERLNLEELAERDALTLSGGEAQKVTLGRAMVLRPRLLLLDEPLASLDVPTRKMLRRDISRLVRDMGVTAIYVTHDYHEVLEVADRLAVLLDGSLHQVGKPNQVFGRPSTEEVAEFLGAENLLEGEVKENREGMAVIEVEGVAVEALSDIPPGARAKLLIHPEEVTLMSDAGEAGSARNRLPGRVTDVNVMGALVKVGLECGFPLVAYVTRASQEEMNIEKGRRVTAVFKATSIHVMPFTQAGDGAA